MNTLQGVYTVDRIAPCMRMRHACHSQQHHAHAPPPRPVRKVAAGRCINRQRYTGSLSSRRDTAVRCAADDEEPADSTIEVDLKVSGMGMQEVDSVDVNLESGIATVQATADSQMDAVTNLLPRLVETVEGLGFEAEPYFG